MNEELRENDQRRQAILRWNDLLAACSDPGAVTYTLLGLQQERGFRRASVGEAGAGEAGRGNKHQTIDAVGMRGGEFPND